jgi:hypothetical protein
MARTQIQFTEQQLRQLRAVALQERISVAEVVRRCVDRLLTETPPDRSQLYVRAAGLIGRFQDMAGATDLAVAHDRYLDESYS